MEAQLPEALQGPGPGGPRLTLSSGPWAAAGELPACRACGDHHGDRPFSRVGHASIRVADRPVTQVHSTRPPPIAAERDNTVAVRLRLTRVGKKKQPSYRIVAADSRSPRDGRYLEIVGTYDPRREPSAITVDNEKAIAWLRNGALPTERVAEAAADLRRLGRVPGLEGSQVSDGRHSYGRRGEPQHAVAVLEHITRSLVEKPDGVTCRGGRLGRLGSSSTSRSLTATWAASSASAGAWPTRSARSPAQRRSATVSRSTSSSSTEGSVDRSWLVPTDPVDGLLEVGRIAKVPWAAWRGRGRPGLRSARAGRGRRRAHHRRR